jgi:LGFP repeat
MVSVAADADDAVANGEAGRVNISASDAQGVQVGDYNMQINVWEVDRRLDAASLGDLAPHHAVAQIRAMGHHHAVVPLATAEVDPAVKVLDVLLKADEALAVSLLADISREKAGQLITALAAVSPDREWLEQLPEAAAAIGNRGMDLKWADPGLVERVVYYRLASNSGSFPRRKRQWKIPASGYRRTYKEGRIYWSPEGSAQAVTGAILGHYLSNDECGGQFGIPTGEAIPVASAASQRWMQRFRFGAIYSDESRVIPVAQGVVDYLDASGGADQFYPLGAATEATSRYGTHARIQRFSGSRNASSESVYDIGRVYGVGGEIASFYERPDGTSHWLGYPMSNVTSLGSNSRQEFEGGTVFAGMPTGAVAVPVASMNLITESIRDRLGVPVAAEQAAGGEGDRWQFFENGVVTLRGGKREVWLRPDAMGLDAQARPVS